MQSPFYKNMRAQDSYVFFSYFLLNYYFVTYLTLTSQLFLGLSAGNRGGGRNVDLPCITLPPRKKQVQQQFCNIITIFYIATTSQRRRKEVWEAFPESIIEVQRCREGEKCSVSDPPGWQLSVKGDELSLCAAGHGLGSLQLLLWWQLLLLLLWATRRSHIVTDKTI